MAATWAGHLINGFDHAMAADDPTKFFSGSAGSQIATANTRFLRGYGHLGGNHTVAPGSTHRTWRIAVAVKRDPAMGADRTIMALNEASNTNCYATLTNSGDIKIYRGDGTLLGTATSVIPASTWLWIEILMHIDNSAGAALVFVSDTTTPVLSLTSVDTQNGSNNYADRADCVFTSIEHDDFHMSWGSGVPVAGDALPDSTIITDHAVTQGDYLDFTPNSGTNHIDRIRDATAGTLADGDATYLSSNTAGHRESVLFDDLPAAVTDINMVQISAQLRKNDAAARSIKLGTRRSGANSESAAINAADTYKIPSFAQVLDPVTAAAWTLSNVNATQGMVKLES